MPDDPRAAAAHHGGRARHLDDDRHEHLAAGGAGQGREGHRATGQGPPRPGAGRQRVAADPPDRAPRHVGGAGPRRARAGDPGRADAPGGLRADRRQAAGRDPGGRRPAVRAGGTAHDRRTGGLPRRHHPTAGHPQGPHGAAGQPRHGLDPDGVAGAGARPHRIPDGVPHRDPRYGDPAPRLRVVRAVVRRPPYPPHRVARRRPGRPRHVVRDVQPAGARLAVRGAHHRGVRGNDRRGELPSRRHGREHHQGEEAHQHPLVHWRRSWSG